MLKFRRRVEDAADDLLIDMTQHMDDLAGVRFQTPNGRPCILILAIGEDACYVAGDNFLTKHNRSLSDVKPRST